MSAPEAAASSANPAADSNESHEVKADANGNGAIKDEKPAVAVNEEAVDERAANGKSDHGAKDSAAKDELADDRRDRNDRKSYSDRKHGGRNDRDDRNGHRRETFNDRRTKKQEFENLKETDDPDAIRQQVEFYFSTHNLSTDWHLFQEMRGPKNTPVPIKHIHSFKRMARFQPYTAVVNALKESDQLDVVETGAFSRKGLEGVKRKVPVVIPGYDEEKLAAKDLDDLNDVMDLHEILWYSSQNEMDRCVYVKNFGDVATVGQLDLEDFFKPYGSVMVRKRRVNGTGDWKGSVFVEFDSEESQQNFLALDPKPQYRGNDLEIMSKKAYSLMKCEEKGITPSWMSDDPGSTRKAYPFRRGNQNRGRGGDRGSGRGQGNRGRGGHGRFKRGNDYDSNDRRRRDRRRRYDSRSQSRSRSRSASRSPREGRNRDRGEKRNRSRSRSSSGDRDDWNNRRDKFQKSDDYHRKDRRGDRRDRDRDYGKSSRSGNRDRRDRDRDDRKERGPDRDEQGVPVVKDTREPVAKNTGEKDLKRKADNDDRENSTKKKKVEIVEDA